MTVRYYALNDEVRFGVATHNPLASGNRAAADETPRWSVFEDANDTPILEGDFTQRTGHTSLYRGSFFASGNLGFDANSHYEIWASGKVSGIVGRALVESFVLNSVYTSNVKNSGDLAYAVWEERLSNHQNADTTGSGLYKNSQNIYYADIKLVRDATAGRDEIGVQWIRNATPLASSAITNPATSLYNTSDGSTIFQNQVMSYSNTSLGSVRFNYSSLVASGEPLLIVASSTIDGATRDWRKIVFFDMLP